MARAREVLERAFVDALCRARLWTWNHPGELDAAKEAGLWVSMVLDIHPPREVLTPLAVALTEAGEGVK